MIKIEVQVNDSKTQKIEYFYDITKKTRTEIKYKIKKIGDITIEEDKTWKQLKN